MIERMQMAPFNLISEGFELKLSCPNIEDLMLFDQCKIKNKQLLRFQEEIKPENIEEVISLYNLYFKHLKRKSSQKDILKPHKVIFQIEPMINDIQLSNYKHLPAKYFNLREQVDSIDAHLCQLEKWNFGDQHTQELTIKQNLYLTLPFLTAALRCMPGLKKLGIIHEEIASESRDKHIEEDLKFANRYREHITPLTLNYLQKINEIVKKSNISEVYFIYLLNDGFDEEYNQHTLALYEQLAKQTITTLSSLNLLTKLTLGGFPCQSMLKLFQSIQSPKAISHLNLFYPQHSSTKLRDLNLNGRLQNHYSHTYEIMPQFYGREKKSQVKEDEASSYRASMILAIQRFTNLKKLEVLIFQNELSLVTELLAILNNLEELVVKIFKRDFDDIKEELLCSEFYEAISKSSTIRQFTVEIPFMNFQENIPLMLKNKRAGFILTAEYLKIPLKTYLDLLHQTGFQHTLRIGICDYTLEDCGDQRKCYSPEELESMTGRQKRYLHYDTFTRLYTRERYKHHNSELQSIKKHMKRTFNK
ncbi:hypothetical protein FGO68_gene11490 [Halteria grandinella]|uniref:Uncharacterized protein n=1 Tax=Halteria grandinella TaxID=5974 RepID=A0A8J8T655_HALGN|nr:hypothetical protein FGO68_gene11490 [Halteria grandinella]